MRDLRVVEATAADAPVVVEVIHQAFAARRILDPPSTALTESVDSVGAVLASYGGVLCHVDGEPAGAALFAPAGRSVGLRRVGVVPKFQSRGVASAVVGVAEDVAKSRGFDDVHLLARSELPATLEFWRRRGYAETARACTRVHLAKALGAEVVTRSADEAHLLGRRLAGVLRGGDLVILTGELGAGKTTLTQGLGAGLGVRGDITSPTFVISRVHPSLGDGPALVHVDAYRLSDEPELDDLDLDALLDSSVTVVEWGSGIAEGLATDRLLVTIARAKGDLAEADDARVVRVTPVGGRWVGSGVRSSLLASL